MKETILCLLNFKGDVLDCHNEHVLTDFPLTHFDYYALPERVQGYRIVFFRCRDVFEHAMELSKKSPMFVGWGYGNLIKDLQLDVGFSELQSVSNSCKGLLLEYK